MKNIRKPTPDDPLRVLALGAGVQSSYLFLASCLGELPRLDAAIFEDTKDEPKGIYENLSWMTEFGQQHGIPLIQHSIGDIRQSTLDARQTGKRAPSIPLYVKTDGQEREGQMPRQCTAEYKIKPMNSLVRKIIGIHGFATAGRVATAGFWLQRQVEFHHCEELRHFLSGLFLSCYNSRSSGVRP